MELRLPEYESSPAARPSWTCALIFWGGVVVGLGVSIPLGDWVAVSIHDRPPDTTWWYLAYGATGLHLLAVVLAYALYLRKRFKETEGAFWIGMLAGLANTASQVVVPTLCGVMSWLLWRWGL